MTSWASPTASSWRSSACTIACSNHRQKRPLFLSPHPETAALPAFQPSCKILRQSPDFSAFSNQRSSCRLSPYGPNADLLDSVPGCGRRVSSIKSEKTPVRRRDGRVAEGARLESVYTGNRIGGSNPSLSARIFGLMGLAPISSMVSSNGGLKGSRSRHIPYVSCLRRWPPISLSLRRQHGCKSSLL